MKFPMPLLVRGDARHIPLRDGSVDLVVTSPPYFSLRSYSDGGQHYESQIGSEPTPQEYLDNLIDCTREMIRVLKPSGSIWINLGDKFVSDNRGSGTDIRRGRSKYAPAGPAGFVGIGLARQKSLMLLPHRYAIRCVDELGLILRQDQVWKKDNGLPESVTDRTRREHEYLFHMVKQPRYYSAVDEIREPASNYNRPNLNGRESRGGQKVRAMLDTVNPLGKLPGSVWSMPSQPLNVPDHISHQRCCCGRKRDGCGNGLDHHAAFPFALVRPIILGWSPHDVCTACGQGRRPVSTREREPDRPGRVQGRVVDALLGGHGADGRAGSRFSTSAAVVGYACACSDTAALATPGVVLDPFGGTGSAALVAAMHGRIGISVDASWDYCDVIARWRTRDPKERARAAGIDPGEVARIPVVHRQQGSLFGDTS